MKTTIRIIPNSTSVITDADGDLVHRASYSAFGEVRSASGESPTDYTYTGQKYEAGFGLSHCVDS